MIYMIYMHIYTYTICVTYVYDIYDIHISYTHIHNRGADVTPLYKIYTYMI